MDETLKREQLRIYLDDEAKKHLADLKKAFRSMSKSAIATELMAAALEACADVGGIRFPLKFQIIQEGAAAPKTRR